MRVGKRIIFSQEWNIRNRKKLRKLRKLRKAEHETVNKLMERGIEVQKQIQYNIIRSKVNIRSHVRN
jgi:hypothetical protein